MTFFQKKSKGKKFKLLTSKWCEEEVTAAAQTINPVFNNNKNDTVVLFT